MTKSLSYISIFVILTSNLAIAAINTSIPHDFVKIDNNGNELPNSAATWSCVHDKSTGLMWEVKTDSNKDINYLWPVQLPNTPYEGTINQFIDNTNVQSLCGYNDWYLPNINELVTLVNKPNFPEVDDNLFESAYYEPQWSSTIGSCGNKVHRACVAILHNTELKINSGIHYFFKDDKAKVRLVRKVD